MKPAAIFCKENIVQFLLIVLWISLSTCGLSLTNSLSAAPHAVSDSVPYISISADSLFAHMQYLGSDSLQGRGTGTPGETLAAQYIARQLKQWKIQPAGDSGDWFQQIPMHGSRPLQDSQLRLTGGDQVYDFTLNKDYLLYKTGAQTFIPTPVPVVFAGYGIVAPEFDYNDYQSVDVAGKIVVYLSGEPPSHDPAYFNGSLPTIYAFPESKQRMAISRGALGSIMIPCPRDYPSCNWTDMENEFSFEDVTLAYAVSSHLSAVMNPDAASRLFQGAPYSLKEVFKKAQSNTLGSFPLNVKLSFKGEFFQRDFFSANVAGLLEGSDSKKRDSYVLLCAHYDHLGIGPPVRNDSIYNGVFDNAAGVSALLELARAISQSGQKPRRSILFLFTTGEEKGLLGSKFYTDHPLVPLYKTIATVNIDGVALFDLFRSVVGVGADLSTLGEFLEKSAADFNLSVSPIPKEFAAGESYARSDQIAFAQAGIPAIAILDAPDYNNSTREESVQLVTNWMDKIYHTPFDDLHQPINIQAAVSLTKVIRDVVLRLADTHHPPQWKAEVPFVNARLQSIAEKR